MKEIIDKYDEICRQEEILREKKRILNQLRRRKYDAKTKKMICKLEREKMMKEQPRNEEGHVVVRIGNSF